MGAFRAALQAVAFRAALRLSERRELWHFEVANLSESRTGDRLFERIDEVMGLIESVDPGRLARMRQSFGRVVVMPSGGPSGSYLHFLDGCGLAADHLLAASASSVAMTLVHEATHARLHRAGIPYNRKLRTRIEAVCLRAEIDFGRRLPGAAALVKEAESALETEWWDDDSEHRRAMAQISALRGPQRSRCWRRGMGT